MIPAGTVLIGHSDGEGQVEYGSVTQMEDKKFVTTKESLFRREYADERTKLRCYVLFLVHFLDLTTLIPGRLSTLTAQKAE